MTSSQPLDADRAKKYLQEHFKKAADIQQVEMKNENEYVLLIYLKSICDPVAIDENLVDRFYELKSLDEYEQFIRSFPASTVPQDEEEMLRNMLKGCVVVFIRNHVLLFDALLVQAGSIQPPSTENVIQGPEDSFTENIEVNLNMIRHRYQTSSLKVEIMTVGKISRTRVMIMYDANKVEETILEEVRKRLSQITTDIVQSAAEIEKETMTPDCVCTRP